MPFPRVLLIGNYRPDAQQSMLRFAEMMATGLRAEGVCVEVLAPEPCFGHGSKSSGVGKWLRYIDKFLLFPIRLRRKLLTLNSQLSTAPIVHICDHSNGVYAPVARRLGFPVVVTCHDLGAVRGALGEDTDCRASPTGKLLQRWISKSLGYADTIACDSTATLHDVQRLIRKPDGTTPATRTILLGQNTSYQRVELTLADERLSELDWYRPEMQFVLNVGSSLPRKNREGVLRIFARTRERWNASLVFAGQALSGEARQLVLELGLQGRVHEVLNPSNDLLEALYNRAHALLFPSKFEGFGWPVIEAQACGCPVLCSDAGSLAEVAGSSAFVKPWPAEEEFAEELLHLAIESNLRQSSVEQGYANLARFETSRMIADYLQVYQDVISTPSFDSVGRSEKVAT